jgi:hypothetical protein
VKPNIVSRNYAPLPDGVVTLVGFSKLLRQKPPAGRFVDVKSQVFYSTAKNTKSFPAYQHTDGRWVINVDDGLKWWDDKEQRKVDRAMTEDDDEVAEVRRTLWFLYAAFPPNLRRELPEKVIDVCDRNWKLIEQSAREKGGPL